MDIGAEEEEDLKSLMVTTVCRNNGRISRKDAYLWAKQTIMDAYAAIEGGPPLEGGIKAVIPLHSTFTGQKIKIILRDVTEETVRSTIMPAFEKQGTVRRLSAEEELADAKRNQAKLARKAKAASMIGDMDRVENTIREMQAMRGNGGPESKKRKFVDTCMHWMDRSQKIASHGLRELQEEHEDLEE